jgi:hypothetical protein
MTPSTLTVLRIPWIGNQHWRLRGAVAGCDGQGLIAGTRRDTRDLERSNLREAAVDEEFGSIDEAAVVGREENDGFCHLIRIAQPSQRNVGDHARFELPRLFLGRSQAVQSWRCDRSRADRIVSVRCRA